MQSSEKLQPLFSMHLIYKKTSGLWGGEFRIQNTCETDMMLVPNKEFLFYFLSFFLELPLGGFWQFLVLRELSESLEQIDSFGLCKIIRTGPVVIQIQGGAKNLLQLFIWKIIH